jgi:phospholipase C
MNLSALLGLLTFAAAVSAAPPEGLSKSHSSASISNLKNKIKNVVILEMENRSFDNLLGGQTLEGLENPINNGPFCNPYNLTDESAGKVCSTAKDFDSILDDPDHSVTGNNIEFYGTFAPSNAAIASGKLTPTQQGFVHEQLRRYGDDVNKTELATQVLNYYTEDEVPVFTSLVQNYLTFNHWHSDHPGVSYFQFHIPASHTKNPSAHQPQPCFCSLRNLCRPRYQRPFLRLGHTRPDLTFHLPTTV